MRTLRTGSIAVVAIAAALALVACNPSTSNNAAPSCVPIIGSVPTTDASGAIPAPTVGPVVSPIDVSSPEGVIVFADGDLSKATGRLHVVWPDKSHLADLSPQLIGGFAVSPDGKTVELDSPTGVSLAATDGTNERPLFVGGLNADHFAWSHDGHWLVFHGWSSDPNAESMYEVDAGGGCQPVRVSLKGAEHDTPIAVSPDGSTIVAIGGLSQSSQKLDVGTLYLDRPGAGTRTVLGADGSTTLVQSGTGPAVAWSPDGKHLAFTQAPTNAENWAAARNGLFLADADGSNPKVVVGSGIVSGVAWSPDSETLATTRIDPNGVPQVFTLKVDGSSAAYLTRFQSPGACCPVWSPDGASLLTWGGTIIPVSGADASILSPAAVAGPYAYAWVKP
jgi:Tol biopolymer transport system component